VMMVMVMVIVMMMVTCDSPVDIRRFHPASECDSGVGAHHNVAAGAQDEDITGSAVQGEILCVCVCVCVCPHVSADGCMLWLACV
jgi:hypothetical protein